MTSLRVKRLCLDAMLLGVALMLSYLEAILPLSVLIPLPGVKPGLANVAVMICFYKISHMDALLVTGARVVITAMLFGNISSLVFSVFGALFAYTGMYLVLLFREKVSYYGISVFCAALHNIGQCVAGIIILDSISVISYLPLLLVFSVIFGFITGAVITPISKLRLFSNV